MAAGTRRCSERSGVCGAIVESCPLHHPADVAESLVVDCLVARRSLSGRLGLHTGGRRRFGGTKEGPGEAQSRVTVVDRLEGSGAV
jgi:hypothetical protein